MSAKHTPGPWHKLQPTPARFPSYAIRADADKAFVAEIPLMAHGQSEANARLIAAAPELLECLSVLVEPALGENLTWLADQLDLQIRQKDAETLRKLAQLEHAWRCVVATIAKAEGRQP